MATDQNSVTQHIQNGMADARAGRVTLARKEFEHALALDAQSVEALLWLAALASEGETSLRYLARALEIDPRNTRAHAGLRWARKRIKPAANQATQRMWLSRAASTTGIGDDQPTLPVAHLQRDATVPSASLIARLSMPAQALQPVAQPETAPARSTPLWQWLAIVLLTACGLLAGGIVLINATLGDHAQAAAPIAQITSTPSAAPIASETPTATPEPVATLAPTDTSVPTASATPPPTDTPIPLPTDTPYIPPPPPTADIPPAGGDPSARWVDVNLTTQSATAYEGDVPVRYFTVSTGLWNTPTVTGQFNIYLRYDSQTMSGPGYYLPGVKWVQYFYQGYALHGTYWHNNFGQPMSHGCVNFTEADAEWLYGWAGYGTLVNVHH